MAAVSVLAQSPCDEPYGAEDEAVDDGDEQNEGEVRRSGETVGSGPQLFYDRGQEVAGGRNEEEDRADDAGEARKRRQRPHRGPHCDVLG